MQELQGRKRRRRLTYPQWLAQLGKRIQDLREQNGLSLRDLAKGSGVSAGQLSRIERAAARPSVQSLWGIARALNVEVEVLV